MIGLARLAINDVFSPPFRTILFKSLGLTFALLIAGWFGLEALVSTQVELSIGWLDTALEVLAGLALFVGAVFLIVPVTALVAGLYLDHIAALVERTHYPGEREGTELPVMEAATTAITFALFVVGVNLVAILLILIIPGLNFALLFLVNAYLIGREYFELAARRYRSAEDAKFTRKRHSTEVFLAGLLIAGLLAVPILNLVAPLFATSLMVHLHKKISHEEAGRPVTVPAE